MMRPMSWSVDLSAEAYSKGPQGPLGPVGPAGVPGTGAEQLFDLIAGCTDHGGVSGAVAIDPAIGTHVLDATGATTLTIGAAPDGTIVTLYIVSGAANVGVDGIIGVELPDAAFASFGRIRGAWVVAAAAVGSSGTPDTTPPSAIIDLAASPGVDGTSVTLTWSASTDADSIVKYRARVYPTGDAAPAWPTSGALYDIAATTVEVTGLIAPEDYTAEVHAYSSGGSSAADTATFATVAPPAWAVVVTDAFTATNGTLLSAHAPDVGPSNLWASANAGHVIQSNKASTEAVANTTTTSAAVTTTTTIHRISVAYDLSTHTIGNLSHIELAVWGGGTRTGGTTNSRNTFHVIRVKKPTYNSATATLSVNSDYGGVSPLDTLALTPEAGKTLTTLPLAGVLQVVTLTGGGTYEVYVDGVLWATGTKLVDGGGGAVTVGTQARASMFAAQVKLDNLLIEKFS